MNFQNCCVASGYVFFAVLMAVILNPVFTLAQDIPDTPAAKRLVSLTEAISESDESRRIELVVKLFPADFPADALGEKVNEMHEMTSGVSVEQILKSEDHSITAVWKTGAGPRLEVQLDVSGEGEHFIEDVGVEDFSDDVLEAFGNFTPVVGENSETFEPARGVWLAKGYGYLMEVTDDGLELYDYTGKFGWKLADTEDMDMFFEAGEKDGTGTFTMHPKEPGYNVVKLDELPECCRNECEWTPTNLFDLFADVMTKHYPFFEQRNVDWQARIEKHRPQINDEMSEKELFDVMASMLENLRDAHTGLSAEIDGEDFRANVGSGPTRTQLRKAFEAQTEIESTGQFISSFRNNYFKCVMDDLLGGNGTKSCGGRIAWGRIGDDIGYINIGGMGGFGIGNTDEQVQALHTGMNEILANLSETKAMIVDISLNPGGSDLFSLEIAAHFADEKRVGFSKWPAAAKEYRNDRHFAPYTETDEDGVVYSGPVYLVTDSYTVSAGEIFTMCMRALPNVTTVGKPTSGALSDVLDKSLPNGWNFHTSNEVYVDHEEVCYEGKGIPPVIEMDIFNPENVMDASYHPGAIRKIAEMAMKKAEAGN